MKTIKKTNPMTLIALASIYVVNACSSGSGSSGGGGSPSPSANSTTPTATPASTPSPAPAPSTTPAPAAAANNLTCSAAQSYAVTINGTASCPTAVPLYRFINQTTGDFFLTLDSSGEGLSGYTKDNRSDTNQDNICCYVYDDSAAVQSQFAHVIRLVMTSSTGALIHFYTTDQTEANMVVSTLGFKIEKSYAVFSNNGSSPVQPSGTVPLLRFANQSGQHFYTTTSGGESAPNALGYKDETSGKGIAWVYNHQ